MQDNPSGYNIEGCVGLRCSSELSACADAVSGYCHGGSPVQSGMPRVVYTVVNRAGVPGSGGMAATVPASISTSALAGRGHKVQTAAMLKKAEIRVKTAHGSIGGLDPHS